MVAETRDSTSKNAYPASVEIIGDRSPMGVDTTALVSASGYAGSSGLKSGMSPPRCADG